VPSSKNGRRFGRQNNGQCENQISEQTHLKHLPQSKRSLAAMTPQRTERDEVRTIAVIGAGTIGRGIANAAALGGYRTVLEDVSRYVLEQAMAWIRQAFEEGVARGNVAACVRDKALSLISTAGDVKDAIHVAELIIEAVPEELEMKLELFTIFDKFAKTGAIFASTASSLSITDFTDIVVSRDRCIGMHFFNFIPRVKRIELVRTPYTSDETVATCRDVARRMGGEVLVVEEAERGVYDCGPERPAEKRVPFERSNEKAIGKA
jgi:3-hydroxyacyl-CoA dehydrogenase